MDTGCGTSRMTARSWLPMSGLAVESGRRSGGRSRVRLAGRRARVESGSGRLRLLEATAHDILLSRGSQMVIDGC